MGRAKRTSVGTLGAHGPRPTEYVDERSGRDTQRVTFDWQANTITRRYQGNVRTEPVPRLPSVTENTPKASDGEK